MLEKIPASIGAALVSVRAGTDGLALYDPALTSVPDTILVTSPVFAHRGALPMRATADGEGLSPPLAWSGVPEGTEQLVLIVEDADSPTPSPLVHAIAFDLPSNRSMLDPGELNADADADGVAMGKSSSLRPAYMPPDPPTGHGKHRYYFQMFAIDRRLDLSRSPGRTELLRAIRGHVLATGCIVGTYERR